MNTEKLVQNAARLFADRDGETLAWETLEEAGLVSVPEESGNTLREAAQVLHLAGRYAINIPLAETVLMAGWALASSDLVVPEGPLTAAPVHAGERIELQRSEGGWTLSGAARRVPWARSASRIAIIGRTAEETFIALVDPASCQLSRGENLAGEPRDDVTFDGARVDEAVSTRVDEEELLLRGALARSVLMAGSLERVLELSLRHAREREQFGRPIGRFQAIQHHLATLAGEVAAANAAVEAAVQAAELARTTGDAAFEIAAAKVRAGEAVGTAAAIAHQIHGAIGFTERHPLRHHTLRLWSWREEFGSEDEWAARLGSLVTRRGPEALWPAFTSQPSGGTA